MEQLWMNIPLAYSVRVRSPRRIDRARQRGPRNGRHARALGSLRTRVARISWSACCSGCVDAAGGMPW